MLQPGRVSPDRLVFAPPASLPGGGTAETFVRQLFPKRERS